MISYLDSIEKDQEVTTLSILISQRFSNFFNSYSKAYNKMFDRKGKLFLLALKKKETSNKLKIFGRLMESARAAFIDKRFADSFLILKSAESTKIINKEFYLMLGIVTYYSKDVEIGRKYLQRGYDKFGSVECKEALKLLY